MSSPADREGAFLASLARAPHVGKVGLVLLALLLGGDLAAAATGRIATITAGFLAFAALTGTLFLLCFYDLVITAFRIAYRPAPGIPLPEPFRIGSDVLIEYVRWLSPLGFVVGIIAGHYFWQ